MQNSHLYLSLVFFNVYLSSTCQPQGHKMLVSEKQAVIVFKKYTPVTLLCIENSAHCW